MILTSVFSLNVSVFADAALPTETEIDDRGNFDDNENITANDASILLDYILDKAAYKGNYSDELFEYMGDVNSDGAITAADAAEILKKGTDGNYKFSGKKPPRPQTPTVEVTTESKTEAGTDGKTETATEVNPETTTEVNPEATTEVTTETIVEGEPAEAIYNGYDIVVDKRIESSNPTREGQPIVKTVREALALTNGGTEDNPVVIGIVPELYREQIYVDVPWITFKKITNSTSSEDEVTLTWYYLEGYTYDNVGANGYWDPENPKANEGGNRGVPQWGQSTYVSKNATGFKAIGIYFENSSNLYVTQEELDANVRVNPTNAGPDGGKPALTLPQRNTLSAGYGNGDKIKVKLGTGAEEQVTNDVRAKRWRDRGAALYTKADKIVLENCKVRGTQDSLGVLGNRVYFKNCYLAGTVDFICGESQAVFDSCEIHWESSPYTGDGDGGGALTAAKNDGYPAKGYLFWNCKVTGNPTTEQVHFGRPWSGETAETIWVNTVSDISKVNNKVMISDAAWASMGCQPELTRGFFEYGSKDVNGKALNTSKRKGTTNDKITGGVLDEFDVIKYNPYTYTAYKGGTFDGWDPSGSKAVYDAVDENMAKIVIADMYDSNFTLPDAPTGYEVRYESDSQNAVIGADGKSVTVTRPPFGSDPANVNITAYLKQNDTIIGAEKVYATSIKASEDQSGSFKLTGKINLSFAASKDLKAGLEFAMPSGVVMGTKEVTIPAGSKTVDYDAGNLYAGMPITLTVTLDNEEYSVVGGDVQTIPAGTAGSAAAYNISVGPTEVMDVTSKGVPVLTGTAPSGYTMETAADAEKGNVYHYKNTNKTKSTHGYYWDLAAMVEAAEGQSAEDLKTADSVTLEFSIKSDGSKWGNDTNAIDILGNGDPAEFKYANDADDTRYARLLMGQWNQLNVIGCNGGTGLVKTSESETGSINNVLGKFNDDNQAKNKWKKFTLTVDFKNKKIIVPKGQGGKNGIDTLTVFPENIDRNKLYMVFYPGSSVSDPDEYYFTDVKISYDRFIPEEDTANGVSVSGRVSDGIEEVVLVNKTQPLYKHTAVIADDKTITFDGKIPAGVYEVRYTVNAASKLDDITGTGVVKNNGDGKYYLTVSAADITNLNVSASAVVGFDGAKTAIDNMLSEYAGAKTEGGTTVYTLKEALPAVSEDGYEISIKEGCAYVNTDGSLIEKAENGDESSVSADLVYVIKNLGTDTTEEYTVKVLPATVPNAEFVETYEELPVGSTIKTGNYTANIVKDSTLAQGRGNVLVFEATDGSSNIEAVSFDNGTFEEGKTYAVSMDLLKTEVSTGGNGWRVYIIDTVGTLWDGAKFAFDKGYEVGNGENYTDDAVYGTTKDIMATTEAGKWYKYTFVCDSETGNVDAYVDGKYITSYKGSANLPNRIKFVTHYTAVSKIYADNIVVYEYPKESDIEADFNDTVKNISFPTSITESSEITVPARTAGGSAVKWTSSDGSLITISESDGKVTFAKATGNFDATLTATITCNLPFTGSPSGDTVTFTKNYNVKFVPDESQVTKYSLTVENKTANSGLKVTVLQGETVKAEETEISDSSNVFELPAGTYSLKLTFASGFKASGVKLGDEVITAGEDGNYTVNLNGAKTVSVTAAEVVTGYDAAEAAITDTLSKAGSLSGDVYTVTKAFTIPTVDKYEISVAENSAVGTDGTLKRGDFGTAPTAQEVTFKIKNTDAGTEEDYKVKILVPAKVGGLADENFEGLNIGDKFNNVSNAIVAYDENRGRYVKFNYAGSSKTLQLANYTLENNKKYEIYFDVMRTSTVEDFSKSKGWKISFTSEGNYDYFRYTGNKFSGQSGTYDDNKKDIITGCENGKWYSLKFVVDVANQKTGIYVYNETDSEYKFITNVTFYGGTPGLIAAQEWYGSDSESICFDNVYVKEITE